MASIRFKDSENIIWERNENRQSQLAKVKFSETNYTATPVRITSS